MNAEQSNARPLRLAVALLLAGFVAGTGCGGSSSSGSGGSTPPPSSGGPPSNPPPSNPPSDPPPSEDPPPTMTGVFTDSAVANIGYRTATQEGVTNEDGEFNYVEGESVVFFIGELELPPVAAKAIVTPLDIAATDQLDHPVVVNIARLLQSLDADGDPENNIQIPSTAVTYAFEVDFTLPVAEFENLANVVNLIANSGSVTTSLVSQDAALQHLTGTLAQAIVGGWRYTEDGVDVIVTFLPNGQYMHAEVAPTEGGGWSGVEHGSYTWDPISGKLTVHEIFWDTNGTWGLSSVTEASGVEVTFTLNADGSEAVFHEDGGDESPTFTRIVQSSEGVVGSWTLTEGSADVDNPSLVVVTLLSDGKYFVAQVGPEDLFDDGMAGVEYGVYEWNAETGALTAVEILEDTNGTWGMSHPDPDTPVLLERDGRRLYHFEGDDEFYFGEVCARCEIPDWS